MHHEARSGCTFKPTYAQKTEESQSEPELLPEGSYFEIHFIDVGQADAELIICDDHAMLVDGGYKSDSSLIYSYLKKENITELDYIICSHPHEDHVGGLAGALNYTKAKNALCPVDSYDSDGFNDFKKYLDNQGVEITKPAVGESFSLGNSTVSVLGCIRRRPAAAGRRRMQTFSFLRWKCSIIASIRTSTKIILE